MNQETDGTDKTAFILYWFNYNYTIHNPQIRQKNKFPLNLQLSDILRILFYNKKTKTGEQSEMYSRKYSVCL